MRLISARRSFNPRLFSLASLGISCRFADLVVDCILWIPLDAHVAKIKKAEFLLRLVVRLQLLPYLAQHSTSSTEIKIESEYAADNHNAFSCLSL
jgi:hypothetical protein